MVPGTRQLTVEQAIARAKKAAKTGNEQQVQAEGDDEVRAVVLHGRPGKFSAGFDLGVMFGDDMSAIIDLVADGGVLVHRLYGSSVPVVAASTGHALAAGALLLLGCDVRVAGDAEAKVGLNEVAIKMVLPENVRIRDLYRLAAEQEMQVRRLDYKRDSLQDIFLKAMGVNHGGL